jgi:hypothetical protein
MNPVDILTMAVDSARMIRNAADPDAVLAAASRLVGCPPGDPAEPLATRITRLVEGAGERRTELYEFLRTTRGSLYLNRNTEGWDEGSPVAPYEPDPEIPELLAFIDSEEGKSRKVDILGEHMGAFAVGPREVVHYIHLEHEEEQPTTVRGLIDYPLEKAVLFPIETGVAPWYLWDILSAFADQYARIYEEPQRFEVWGHDLSDLWIERLFYFPQKKLIYPFVGS